jgi:cation-transporting P-type ATPase E
MMTIRHLFQRNSETAAQRETSRSYWQILSTNLFSFFNLILFSVGGILLAFGRYNDAFITAITAIVSAAMRTFQEVRAKRQLDQIALLVRPQATVIRDGAEQTIDGGALVQGELIHLRTGDQALADGVVVGERVAEVDESLLTGESDPVRKALGDKIYSGSFCVTGDLFYQADAVGTASFAHQLAASARVFTTASTPLKQQISFVVRLLMVLTLVMALIFYIGGWPSGSTLLHYIIGSAVLVGLVPYTALPFYTRDLNEGRVDLRKTGGWRTA